MSKAQDKRDARDAARAELARRINQCSASQYRDGETRPIVYINVTRVARSGMSRQMCVYVIVPSEYATAGELVNVTVDVATACELTVDDRGVRVNGAGMDMRWWLVDRIAHVIGRGDGNDYDVRGL